MRVKVRNWLDGWLVFAIKGYLNSCIDEQPCELYFQSLPQFIGIKALRIC